MKRLSFLLIAVSLLAASCEKKESPISLPEKGSAAIDRVDMGEDYHDQVFYDFEKGYPVYQSAINSWDLAFEASPTGFHIFMNGGKDVWVYNTHQTDILGVLEPPKIKNNEWQFDSPSGLPDSTAIGNWQQGRRAGSNVFIVKMNPAHFKDTFKKIVLTSASTTEYRMTYADLRSGMVKSIVIPKEDKYNFAYFSFDEGGKIVYPEPPKDSWDIVFTRYRHVYYHLNNFPYIVSGALLNPFKTTAYCDSTTGYEAVTITQAATAKFSNARDEIGFEWKFYDIPSGKYTVDKKKTYVVNNRKGQFWKVRFLDFYNSNGVKGSPSFEYERLH
ncbi:MAG: hypothetical protein K0R82_1575 [Flavipsychrobacter sp.]|nr:hypothetical protein [Flavipsychrobacter sp.]